MKFIPTVGIAVLFGVLVAWWLIESEDETNAMPVPAVAGDVDASREMADNGETPQRQGSRQPVTPSGESTAGRDVGSDSGSAAPAGDVIHSPPGAEQVYPSAPGTEQIVLRSTSETIPGRAADSKSSQPSALDKTDCEAAAMTLEESWSIYDLTPTLAIAYAGGRSPHPYAAPSGFSMLKERLLATLCSGTSAFNRAYPAQMEFVAVSTDSHARILVGDHWISEGTVLSPLSESDQQLLTDSVMSRRNTGRGPNGSREEFERKLARNPNGWSPGP
jgi:hypothetical protein